MATTADAERHVDTARPGARGAVLHVAVGIAIVVLGMNALVTPAIAGVFSAPLVLGVLLIVAGLVEGLAALRRAPQRGLWRTLLAGVLSVAIGVSLLAFPVRPVSVPPMIGAFFLVAGLFRTITSMLERYADWGWDLGYGVAIALLGTYVLTGWPAPSRWTLALLVGLELLLRGGAWIGAGSALRGGLERTGSPSHGRR